MTAADRTPREPAKGGSRGWLNDDSDGLAELPLEVGPGPLLEQIFRLEPRETLRSVPGRETFAWPGHADWIVKRTSGGEPRDFWYERLHGGARSPARRETENLRALAKDGIPVPAPFLWVESREATGHPRRGGRSALVMRRVAFQETLRQALADSARGESLGAELLGIVVRLHSKGWVHRDLYTQHLVLGKEGLVLLDVGRARQSKQHSSRWFVKDLAALQSSLPPEVTRSARLRFLRSWLTETGRKRDVESRRARRRWANRILAKARRLRAHVPRHLDPHDPVDAQLLREGTDASD